MSGRRAGTERRHRSDREPMAASRAELDLCRSQPFPVAVTAGLLSPALIAVLNSSPESARVYDSEIARPRPRVPNPFARSSMQNAQKAAENHFSRLATSFASLHHARRKTQRGSDLPRSRLLHLLDSFQQPDIGVSQQQRRSDYRMRGGDI